MMIDLGLLNAVGSAEEEELGVTELASFTALFASASADVALTEYPITEGVFPAAPDAHPAYLLTGSSFGVYDAQPWIAKLGDFVRAAFASGQKLVGICFGHQLLAHALGGHAEKAAQGWGLGAREMTVEKTPVWLNPPLEQCRLYYCHQDQVISLPPNAVRLGNDPFCPNGMFAIGSQVFGIQGHPEFTPQFMGQLADYFAADVGETVYETAVATLNNPTNHNSILAQWIVNFLKHDPKLTIYH